MKKEFQQPELIIILFTNDDIVTVSDDDTGEEGSYDL